MSRHKPGRAASSPGEPGARRSNTNPNPRATADTTALTAVIEPAVASTGYDLETVTLTRAGTRSVLRVVVDSDDGVSLDAVATLSTAISAALDERSDVDRSSAYTLEVTSPGVDRPLTTQRHWRRAHGRLVRVAVADEVLTGRVVSADGPDNPDGAGVTLDVDGVEQMVRYDDLGPGKVQIEFSRGASRGQDEESS